MSRTQPDAAGGDGGVGPPEAGRPSASPGGLLRATAIAFGVGVLGFVLGIVLFFLALNVLFLSGLLGEEASGIAVIMLSTVSLQGLAFPIVAALYLRWRDLPVSFLRIRRPSLTDVGYAVAGLVGALFVVIVASQAISALGLTPAERGDTEILSMPRVAAVMIPVAILLIGPGEELLFRGVIQTTVREVASAPVAIVVASMAFAPAHIVAYLGTGAAAGPVALSISVLFLPSLVFGAVYELSDNLVVPSLSHGLYNALLFALVLLGPSLGAGSQGAALVLPV